MSDNDIITENSKLRALLGDAHPLVTKKVLNALDDEGERFIRMSPIAFLSTSDKEGFPDVSPRGDHPGFVTIENSQTLYIPERPGNKLAFSLQNILVNPNIALLFIIPGVLESYRVHGTARITTEPELLARIGEDTRGKTAALALEVRIRQCFLHCGKALIRSELWSPESQQTGVKFRFGATTAREAGGDAEMVSMIDEIVEEDYRDNL
ncbi:MAG: MSMEG_1061 family FMN-dependent PPOX-type flavoprotein [Pseudomonadota bacterium]